jgi:hypothetical protein
MTKDTALRLALEALEAIHTQGDVACVVTPNGAIYIKPVITAIKAALANEALERKAENARELGLDYEPLEAKDEPWEKFCDSNCVWTDHHPDCKLANDEPVATDWERIARVQNAKLMAMLDEAGGFKKLCEVMDKYEALSPTPPPVAEPHKRKPLTDEQVDAIWPLHTFIQAPDRQWLAFARAIEAAHGIKE